MDFDNQIGKSGFLANTYFISGIQKILLVLNDCA